MHISVLTSYAYKHLIALRAKIREAALCWRVNLQYQSLLWAINTNACIDLAEMVNLNNG